MVQLKHLTAPCVGVKHEQNDVDLYDDGNVLLGKGSFFICENSVVWLTDDSSEGVQIPYEHVALHAISRGEENFPKPCIYLMVDSGDENKDEEDSIPCGLKFAPTDETVLSKLFGLIAEGQRSCPGANAFSGGSYHSDDESSSEEEFTDEETNGTGEDNVDNDDAMSDGFIDGQFDDAPEM